MKQPQQNAGNYRICGSVTIGHKELVWGENSSAGPGQRYLCAYHETNELFSRYVDCMVSDDYAEIIQLFGQRMVEETRALQKEVEQLKASGVSVEPITMEQCVPDDPADSLVGRVVVMRPEILRAEFQRPDCQVFLVTGGFGAQGNARGRKVFCTSRYHGRNEVFFRSDVLGTLRPECTPAWVSEKLAAVQARRREEKQR